MDEVERVLAVIAKRIGVVGSYGAGTAKDPHSAWFEVKPWKSTKERVVEILRDYDLGDRIQDIFPIQCGEGAIQARQMFLIPLE